MDWLNDNSGAIQGVATVVLVLLTIYYAKSTRDIAQETRDMTSATEQMVAVTRQEQLDDDRPVIAFRLLRYDDQFDTAPSANEFRVELINAGIGPALDCEVEIVGSPLNIYYSRGPVLPMVMAVGEWNEMDFKLHDRSPFLDRGALSWPRDDQDVEVEHIMTPIEMVGRRKAVMANNEEGLRHHYERFDEYQNQVKQQVALLEGIGKIRAVYRDVHGRIMTSESELRLVEWQSIDGGQDPPPGYWKRLELGPVSLTISALG